MHTTYKIMYLRMILVSTSYNWFHINWQTTAIQEKFLFDKSCLYNDKRNTVKYKKLKQN